MEPAEGAGFGPDFIASLKPENFEEAAVRLARWQYQSNSLLRSFADAVKRLPAPLSALTNLPFLPISFFKTHRVASGLWEDPELVFRSSGTTAGGDARSTHVVRSAEVYDAALLRGFEDAYGPVKDWAVLALLPSYLERGDSSLVHMARTLMAQSSHPANGFYLTDFAKLAENLQSLEAAGQKTLLLGVTFALLDFAEAFRFPLRHTTVMETGGMKGRREEWTRTQVHSFLKQQWHLQQVHSEYGMTELLSQAYAKSDGLFNPAPTARVLVRDVNDPLDVRAIGSGVLNIVDLANVHSCAFVATEDLGTVYVDGSFEVIGRMDHTALRGCSLMVV